MKIADIWQKKKFTFSLEVFPPKKEIENWDAIEATLRQLAQIQPDFISVTYGAGGSTNKNTVQVARFIKSLDIEPLAHLTCANETREGIDAYCQDLLASEVHNLMALRGDDFSPENPNTFQYASDLMAYIHQKHPIYVAGACYPELHKESLWVSDDIKAYGVKEKAGAQFLISQLFFDNTHFYKMLKEMREQDITLPILAGIMPITDAHQFIRIRKLTGASIPDALASMIEAYKDNKEAMFEIGINWAVLQISDLLSKGVDGIHLYTMNNPKVALEVHRRIDVFLKDNVKER